MHKSLETDRVGFRFFGVSGFHPEPFDSISTSPWVGGLPARYFDEVALGSGALRLAGGSSVTLLSPSRGPNPSKLIQQFLTLRPDQQLHIFNTLKAHLVDKGMLGGLEDA